MTRSPPAPCAITPIRFYTSRNINNIFIILFLAALSSFLFSVFYRFLGQLPVCNDFSPNTASGAPAPENPLTPQQSRFVDAYIQSLDPLCAARRAGYAKSGIHSRARELLFNPKIIAEIYRRIDQNSSTLQVSRAFIVKRLLDIIDTAGAHEPVLDRSGEPTGQLKIRDASVALRAIEALSKHFPLSAEKPAQNPDVQVVCVENLDDTKI